MAIVSSDDINSVLKTYWFVEKKIKWFKAIKVLDLGCDRQGNAISELANLYNKRLECYGISTSMDKYPNNVKIVIGKPDKLPFEDEFFDVVYSYNYMYYFEDEKIRSILKDVLRVLKPNGYFVFNDYRRNSKRYGDDLIPSTCIKAKIVSEKPKLIIKY
ncbi:MAG TPA: class I SAM-dependent methyltransferase [Candidatus Nanoarchaeia archaeon]|nr:class I SAM-dependent methyltransferase [Candidatus Nanoarchaeia archaeon]